MDRKKWRDSFWLLPLAKHFDLLVALEESSSYYDWPYDTADTLNLQPNMKNI